MITEHVPISEFRHVSGCLNGKFILSHVANPDTVKVVVQNRLLYPDSFTPFGDPIFDEEQYFEFLQLEKQSYDLYPSFRERKRLTAEITYEPLELTLPRSEFDTISGIRRSFVSMYSFFEMLSNRRCYVRETNYALNEYILFGRYLLDSQANVLQIRQNFSVSEQFQVCKPKLFVQLYGGYIATPSFAFPKRPNDLCPLCGGPFLMSHLRRNEVFQYANGCGPAAHTTCTVKHLDD